MSEDKPTVSVGSRLLGVLARSRPAVILGSGVAAALVAFVALWFEPQSGGVFAWLGLFATAWALVLAIAIFIVSSRDTQGMLDQIEDLTEQVGSLAPKLPAQGRLDLQREMHKLHDYVVALMAEFPIPAEDIISIRRRGKGKGNRPVIIDTLAGRRYSVYKGGRGKSGYTVTALPEEV